MTMNEYLSIKSDNTKKFDKEYELLKDQMKYKIYRFRDLVIYHIIVPSGKAGGVTYDVIIELKLLSKTGGDAKVDNLPIRVFSNCPSFEYGHAFRHNQNGELCDWLADKYYFNILNSIPLKEREITAEKSLYLSMRYIMDHNLNLDRAFLNDVIYMSSLKEISKLVRNQYEIDNKIEERVAGKRAEREEKKAQKEIESTSHLRTPPNIDKKLASAKTTKVTGSVKAFKKVGKVSLTARAKRSKHF